MVQSNPSRGAPRRRAAIASSSSASSTSVAPKRRAHSRRSADGSIASTEAAPRARAPCRGRPARPRALNGVDTDATRADHGPVAPGGHVDARDRSPHAGNDGASHQCAHLVGYVGGEGDETALGHDRMVGEASQERVGAHRLTVGADGGPARGQAPLAHGVERVLAENGPALQAVAAVPAARRQIEQDPRARLDCNVRAEPFHDASALVPQHGGQGEIPLAVGLPDVAVTDPGGADAHERLTGAGCSKAHVLDPLGRPELAQDCGAGQYAGHLGEGRDSPIGCRPL
jgi:hypothetical protein